MHSICLHLKLMLQKLKWTYWTRGTFRSRDNVCGLLHCNHLGRRLHIWKGRMRRHEKAWVELSYHTLFWTETSHPAWRFLKTQKVKKAYKPQEVNKHKSQEAPETCKIHRPPPHHGQPLPKILWAETTFCSGDTLTCPALMGGPEGSFSNEAFMR